MPKHIDDLSIDWTKEADADELRKETEEAHIAVLKRTIKSYFRRVFKNEDVVPDMVIDGLARKIAEEKYQDYKHVEYLYNIKDFEYAVKNENIKLSLEEFGAVLRRIDAIRETSYGVMCRAINDILEYKKKAKVKKGTWYDVDVTKIK